MAKAEATPPIVRSHAADGSGTSRGRRWTGPTSAQGPRGAGDAAGPGGRSRQRTRTEESHARGNLLYWAIVALVIAVVAGALGFGGIAGAAAGIGKILFWVFLVIFLIVLVMNFMGRGKGPTV